MAIRAEGEKRNDILLLTVLGVLISLVLLNALLYYKLWVLEIWATSSKTSMWHTDVEILKNPPKSHEEWLELLKHQENLHRMELDKWQKVLQSAVTLLKKAEESLNSLQGSIKSPYTEDVMSMLGKSEKQEL